MINFISLLADKNVHIVGVTGSEGSSILDFCLKSGVKNLTVHDYVTYGELGKNYLTWHKGVVPDERISNLSSFKWNLKQTKSYWGQDYLTDIDSADFVFVPQSWRLYVQNKPLYKILTKKIPFYSLTRLYLDFAPAQVLAVTGTVGKGSVSYDIVQLLQKAGKHVYFGGNETWRMQVLSELNEMESDDILVLEISHRQMREGFTRPPKIAVLTNLYPNHLDEVSWSQYKKLKSSLLRAQTQKDISVLNYDNNEVRKLAPKLNSKVYYYSAKNKNMNIKTVQSLYDDILNTKINQFPENLLAASTVAAILNISKSQLKSLLPKLNSLPARLEYIGKIQGVNFYDDIKSTTPWATQAAIGQLGENTILICGGKTKGINYELFFKDLLSKIKFCIFVESELAHLAGKYLPHKSFKVVPTLQDALKTASQRISSGDNVLLSPAAAFFYSDFIKGKKSFRKIVDSLEERKSPQYQKAAGLTFPLREGIV